MAGTITASVVKNDTTSPPAFQNSAGTEIGQLCRAWVNFNGTTGAIRASFNVSSVTRNAAGQYIVNLSNALADTNGVVTCGAVDAANFTGVANFNQEMNGMFNTSSQLYCGVIDMANTYQDVGYCSVAVFR